MNILFVADIVGKTGKWALAVELERIRQENQIDFCVANGENLAGLRGITINLFHKLTRLGVDVVTSGNHIWANSDILSILDDDENILRPLNYPKANPGKGHTIIPLQNGLKIGVINLQGRIFMDAIECPFKAAEARIEIMRKTTPIIIVDMHAEATSEKIAMGWFLDGKVSAVIGTHTHVQSADERILPGGTAYITDAGMTGARDSVIGVRKEIIIKRFLTQTPARFEPADGDPIFNGIIINVDDKTGRATKIERILREVAKP